MGPRTGSGPSCESLIERVGEAEILGKRVEPCGTSEVRALNVAYERHAAPGERVVFDMDP
jgi:hypothetical protein